LDISKSRVHLLEDGVPMLSSVLVDLLDLAEYKRIDKVKARQGISKILFNELPIGDDGMPTLLLEEAEELHKNIKFMVQGLEGTVDVVTSPTKLSLIPLQESNQREQDDIEKATNMVYSSAGTPMVLFNAGSKSSSVGLNLSVQVDEAVMFALLKQYENWYKMKIDMVASSAVKFGIKFLEITRFNRTAKLKDFKEGATYGLPVKLACLAALGFSQREAEGLNFLELSVLKVHENYIPLSSSHTAGAEDGENGAPKKEEPLSDEGQKTLDGDKNNGGA